MSRYIALVHRGETGSWGISFPDFPGCISAADSFEDVTDAGAKALRFHVEGMIEDGQRILEPRSFEALQNNPEFADDFKDAIVSLVPLLPPRAKAMRVNISLDSNLLVEIDAAAEVMGMNRSEFIAEAARRLIIGPSEHNLEQLLMQNAEHAERMMKNMQEIARQIEIKAARQRSGGGATVEGGARGSDPNPPRGTESRRGERTIFAPKKSR